MEIVLLPPTNRDDSPVPETEPNNVPADELPPDADGVEDEGEDADDSDMEPSDPSDLAADPDHESAPPPEVDPAMTFADLKLMRPLMDAISAAGYKHPTPIQEAVIPPALRAKDVIGQAQTG